MSEQLKNIWKSITEFWGKLSKKKKVIIIGGLVVLVIGALIITFILNNKDYVVLFRNMDDAESVEVMQQLQESKIDYKYQTDGTILIPKEQESLLRMQLAQAGHPRTGINYDIFTESIDFMTTDYEKRQYEIFQLQERLQGSIETIDGVKEAIVTINLPQDKSFVWETDKKESSASVKINLHNGYSLSPSQTNGIMQLLVKSIKGLKEENVAILDTNGNSLNISNEMLQTSTIKLKLSIEREFEKETETDVTEFLSKIYGPENVKVSAKCTINFDKKISEILQYLPDEESNQGVPGDIHSEKEITGPGETTGGIPGAETNAEIPTYPGVVVSGDDIYFRDSNTINYLVSQLKEQIEHNPGTIEKLTVAAVINKANMSDKEAEEINQLIAFSAGIGAENIALSNMVFYDYEEPAVPVAATDSGEGIQLRKLLIYGGIALIVISILLIILILVLRKRKKKRALEQAAIASDADPNEYSWADIKDGIKVQETQEQAIKKQLKDFTKTNPEIVSQLVRTWLKGDE